MVLPLKAMLVGLKGHKVAAVYALLNKNYKRGSGEGWEHVQHIGITKDLAAVLTNEAPNYDTAHVRALSFTYPQKATMEDFANGWRGRVQEARIRLNSMGTTTVDAVVNTNNEGGGTSEMENVLTLVGGGEIAKIERGEEEPLSSSNVITVGDDYEFDDEDEDMDEDELDDYLQMMAESRAATTSSAAPLFVDTTTSSSVDAANNANGDDSTIISPFESDKEAAAATSTIDDQQPLELNRENVDKVLDEVRPYLISDGGNVAVHNVDNETGNVYLVLEGACGSCASSTVTMQMGIERVLKEKFEEKLGEVIQVDPDNEGGDGGKPTELTEEAVQVEVRRISQAITAMGGVVRVVNVDPIGVVEIEFRGPNKVKKGLELALLDVEYVKHVKFVS